MSRLVRDQEDGGSNPLAPTTFKWSSNFHGKKKAKKDRLDSNYKIKKSKCFIWCRLGARGPFFLSLSCTEFVPNSQSTQCCVEHGRLLVYTDRWRELLTTTPFRKLRFHLCLTLACRLQPEVSLPKVRGIRAAVTVQRFDVIA